MMYRRLLALAVGLTLIGGPALAIEEPKFTTALRDGPFEIRDYPSAVVAEVTVTGDQNTAASRGFRLLAGYIFGGNKSRQSIAMTAPVAQERTGEKIAMTAPVTQTASSDAWVVRFSMPAAYTLESLPEPNDAKVHLRKTPPARFAVVRFSGWVNPALVESKTNELNVFVRAHRLRVLGPATLAQFNPPWTPWFMRRNEVMIPVAS